MEPVAIEAPPVEAVPPVVPDVAAAPIEAPAVVPEAASAEAVQETVPASAAVVHHEAKRDYPSLYDTKATTIVAVLLGVLIIGGIQAAVHRIYQNTKNEQKALTQFVTMMVALVIGAYMADLLIAGPDTSLLGEEEHTIILGFVKDICLMVFGYYFGTKTAPATGSEE